MESGSNLAYKGLDWDIYKTVVELT